MKTARFLLLLGVIVSLSLTVFGQTATTARITGQVTDAQGAVVVGATVRLVDKATNQEKTTTTNEEGRYAFPSLKKIAKHCENIRKRRNTLKQHFGKLQTAQTYTNLWPTPIERPAGIGMRSNNTTPR